MFQTVTINITGPSYKDRSRPLASQETRNMYHEAVESGKDKYVLKSFPGQKYLGEVPNPSNAILLDRGMHNMLEVAYRVVDDTLYQVDVYGNHTSKGIIPGLDRCIFADDGVSLFIVSDLIVSVYNSSTDILSTVTDVNIVGALSVAFINNQFAYTFKNHTQFSNVGDGTAANGLNAIGAESNPDELVRDYSFNQVVNRMGNRTVEAFFNTGVGTPPFDKIEGQVFNVGINARHSMASTRDYYYWLASDNQIYRARGGQEQVVSSAAVSAAIQSYNVVSNAYGFAFNFDNKELYMITFPSDKKTWCLIEEGGVNGWFELSEGISDGQYNAGSILDVYRETLVGDRSNGKLYKLDFDTYDQAGEPWRRRRVVASINSDVLGVKGKELRMSKMKFQLETGTGLSTGQGEDPQIMLEASYDGGRSWATGTWLKIGRLGQYDIEAEWCSLKSFYDCMVRLTTSDPVAFNIYSATIDVKLT